MKTIVKLVLSLVTCLAFFNSPVQAKADYEIDKVLTTISHEPVALMEVSNISASSSTPGCDVVSCRWVDSYGTMSGWFSTSVCRVEIRVQAYDGYYFSENIAAYLNNQSVSVSRDPDGRYVDLSREYAPQVWAPTVNKHPGSESVEIGDWTSFVATAGYSDSCRWLFTSPEGKYFNGDELKAKFPAVSVDESGEGKLKIYDIPAELDGWSVICRFNGPGGTTDTKSAKITVKNAPAPTPSPEPTPESSPEATPELSEEPSPAVTPEGADEPNEKSEAKAEKQEEQTVESEHTHRFSDSYTGDLMNHWQRCSCGEITKREQHDMQWVTVSEANDKEPGLEKGTCSVCGYSQTRELVAKAKTNSDTEGKSFDSGKFAVVIKAVLAIIGIIGGFILIMYVRFKARRRKYSIKNRRY